MTIEDVYNALDLDGRDCLIRRKAGWQDRVAFPSRIMRLLQDESRLLGRFDAVFSFDGKPLVLFYKDIQQDSLQRLHRDVWNFNETPIVIVESGNAVTVYNGFSLDKKTKFLDKIADNGHLDDFNYFRLVSGEAWVDCRARFERKNRVDRFLLNNIEYAQKALCRMGVDKIVANALLGKVIFIRYLIDRKVRVNYPSRQERLDNKKLCEILCDRQKVWELFDCLQDKDCGFDGDLFPVNRKQVFDVPDTAFELLIRLLKSENLSNGQQSLFDLYDFSILPIEFISNVYEKFIGRDNQASQGAYYTPTFLVDYIVRETVGEKLRIANDNYNCRILDPACGSGIFLVESLREIIEKYMSVTGCDRRNTKPFREILSRLASDNIFGIDKDESAVQVAIFSIYLTLLDYQDPADIEKFKFPRMRDCNLVCADAFDETNTYICAMRDRARRMPFDVILGNPPWRRGVKEMGWHCVKYSRWQAVRDWGVRVTGGEIAQAFLARSLDFATSTTDCALIVTSKVLHNIKAKEFRKDFFRCVLLKRVFELSPVRGEIFNQSNDSAIAPACILFYKMPCEKKEKEYGRNLVEHIALKPSRFFSLFKAFMLTTRDIQYVRQSLLMENDLLWKILVYGSWLDFSFIKRMRTSDYVTIGQVVKDKGLLKGQGVTIGRDEKEDASHLVGRKFADTDDIRPYFVRPTKTWTVARVTRKRDERLFCAPVLLTKIGLDTVYHAASAVLKEDAVYTHAFSAIKGNQKDLTLLRTFAALYNSDFFTYYGIMCFSSLGIDRTRVHEEEMRSLPWCRIPIAKDVSALEGKLSDDSRLALSNFDAEEAHRRIENKINDAFEFSEVERALIDYANHIIVPYCLACDADIYSKELSFGDAMLVDYANVFVRRFEKLVAEDGNRFMVEVKYSKQIIGMYFRVVPKRKYVVPVAMDENSSPKDMLRAIIKLSAGKVTDKLFVHKDLRGFGSDYFYIFKPNERRLWHKAVAYVDVEEFADAILRAGTEK